jgi:hypothetical protein
MKTRNDFDFLRTVALPEFQKAYRTSIAVSTTSKGSKFFTFTMDGEPKSGIVSKDWSNRSESAISRVRDADGRKKWLLHNIATVVSTVVLDYVAEPPTE